VVAGNPEPVRVDHQSGQGDRMPLIELHEVIAAWAAQRYRLDPEDARWYCQSAPGIKILRYLLECYFYKKTEGRLDYSGVGAMNLEKPVPLDYHQAHTIANELMFLLPVFARAAQDDAKYQEQPTMAQQQVKIIKQVANPHRRGMPPADIKKFFDKHHRYEVSLARAFRMVVWMQEIALVVTPSDPGSRSILTGKVDLLDEEQVRFPEIYDRVKAVKRDSTLESLAVSLYRAELKEQGINITARQLQKDLEAYEEWTPATLEDTIPIHIYTLNAVGQVINSEQKLIGFATDDWKRTANKK
jgi:hypothetical protein